VRLEAHTTLDYIIEHIPASKWWASHHSDISVQGLDLVLGVEFLNEINVLFVPHLFKHPAANRFVCFC
jgi:hypothetical protein